MFSPTSNHRFCVNMNNHWYGHNHKLNFYRMLFLFKFKVFFTPWINYHICIWPKTFITLGPRWSSMAKSLFGLFSNRHCFIFCRQNARLTNTFVIVSLMILFPANSISTNCTWLIIQCRLQEGLGLDVSVKLQLIIYCSIDFFIIILVSGKRKLLMEMSCLQNV